MECDSLIDFNSPRSKGGNLLDPLVPLPKSQTNNNHNGDIQAISAVGDNPFDNMILQMCKFNDPFEVTEKLAHERNGTTKDFEEENINKNQIEGHSKLMNKETDKVLEAISSNKCNSPVIKIKQKLDDTIIDSHFIAVKEHSTPLKYDCKHSCSPNAKKIESKFSKLYLSAHLDPNILDESSKCIDAGDSLDGLSIVNTLQSEKCSSPSEVPEMTEDLKSYVNNRIQKCIEKAENESRSILSGSLRHRRSLSASSLRSGSLRNNDNLHCYNSLMPNYDVTDIPFKFRNRSFSKPDVHSSVNGVLGSRHSILDSCSGEIGTASCFDTAFRKSTASSSMYSSYGVCDLGFRKNTSSLASYRPLNSSLMNISTKNIEDSVFLKDDAAVGGKTPSCVLMEAKHLSCVFKRIANADEEQSLEDDFDFLTNDKFKIELVDSDSSCSESGLESNSQTLKPRKSSDGKMYIKSALQNNLVNGEKPVLQEQDQSPHGQGVLPLSRDKVAAMGLRSSGLQSKNRSSLLVQAPPVPLSSSSKNIILKPKSNSDSRVGKRGPMKAMIPVGHMMRQVTKKDECPSKSSCGRQSQDRKRLVSSNAMRRSVSSGQLLSQKAKNSSATPQKSSPAICGRPVACSTPAIDGVPPLVSPSNGLQVSQISTNTPVDLVHRRSKSTSSTASLRPEKESQLTTTPTRKAGNHVRLRSGPSKTKQLSLTSAHTSHSPPYTSTPLKLISRNSPTSKREKKPTQNRKLLRKDLNSCIEKENVQPHFNRQHQPQWRT